MFLPPVPPSDATGSISPRKPAWRGLLLLIVTVLSVLALYYGLIHPGVPLREMTQTQLFDLIKQGRVITIVNEPDPSTGIRTLTGTFIRDSNPVSATPIALQGLPNDASGAFKVPVDMVLSPNLAGEIKQAGYNGIIETRATTNIFWPLVINLFPVILFAGWILFIGVCITRILYKAAFGPRAI